MPDKGEFPPSSSKMRTKILIALGAAPLHFFLAVHGLDAQNLWYDESFTYEYASSADAREFFQRFTREDINPPLYFFLAMLWVRTTDTSEFHLRFPSVLAGTAGVAAVFFLFTDLAGAKLGVLSTFMLAVHPFLINFSQEARPYSLLWLLTVLALLAYRAFLRSRTVVLSLAQAVLWASLCYTHFFGVFPVIFVNSHFILAATTSSRTRVLWLGSFLGFVLLLGPWLPFAINQAFSPLHVYTGLGRYIALDGLATNFNPSTAAPWEILRAVSAVVFLLPVLLHGWRSLRRVVASAGQSSAAIPTRRSSTEIVAFGAAILAGLLLAGVYVFSGCPLPRYSRPGNVCNAAAMMFSAYVLGTVITAFSAALLAGNYISAFLRKLRQKLTRRLVLQDSSSNVFLEGFLLCTLVAVQAVALFKPIYRFRNMIVILPSYIFMCVKGISALSSRHLRVSLFMLYFVLAAISTANQQNYREREDFRSAASYLRENIRQGETVFIEAFFLRKVLGYYYPENTAFSMLYFKGRLPSGTRAFLLNSLCYPNFKKRNEEVLRKLHADFEILEKIPFTNIDLYVLRAK